MGGPNESREAKKQLTPLQVLRQRRGGVPRELIERNKQVTKVRRVVASALESGPKTAPQVAAETGINAEEVFWHLISMKKYGKVAEGQPQGDYFEYALVKREMEQT